MEYKLEVIDMIFTKEGKQVSSNTHEGYLTANELENLIKFTYLERVANITIEINNKIITQAHICRVRYAQDGSYATRIRHICLKEE